jgi:hypothetical protein
MFSTSRVELRISKRAAGLVLATVALTTLSTLPAQASLSHPGIVSANPADTTPHIVLDDTSYSVYAFAQVGSTVYAGGRFSQVQNPARTTTYARQNFVAFDSETGVISALDLSFDGMVTSIEATADGTALFIGGAFARVGGVTRRGIVKYDLVGNRIDPTFAPTGMRTVSDIKIANGAVIAAGNFTKKLMALNPTTGADTGAINVTVAGAVDPAVETRIRYIAVSPDGTRLVATGNFATVNGQGRKRAFMLNLGATATLSTWRAPRFDVDCAARSKLVSAQGVDFSPDGSYFVVVSTGGPTGTSGVCDAAARFETANVSSTVQPTWINWTGGDTLYSVAITGSAVYVGGHQRWLDNPQGSDFAGPGAVSRPGIGAIDPVTGKALAWNPTKSREHGTMVLFATPRGLWVGSDGARFGNEDHAGIGFAPLDPGSAPDTTRPDTVIDSGPTGSVTDTSATFSFSASEPSSFQCSLDGAAFAPCTSPTTYPNLAATPHSFRVAATDGSYNVDASPAEQNWTVVPASTDLVGNPGFEVDTSGWRADASTNVLSRVAGGRSGAWAAELSNSLAGGACGLDDMPSWVSFTQAGTYKVSIWVRSETPGLTLRLRVREYAGGVLQGAVAPSVVLTSSWQQLTAIYTPVVSGSNLDVEAYTVNTPVGVCFRADDASISLQPTVGPPSNQPPATAAGPDQAVTLPNAATLSGAVTDDGLPDAATTAAWSVVSGPGTVTFADPSQASTTALFSAAGTYLLRLTGSDGELSTQDDVTVTVSDGGGGTPPSVLDVPIGISADDAEERMSTGAVDLISGDVNLGQNGAVPQAVGLRFPGVMLPQGARITAAWVQFRVDEVSTAAADLTVAGQAADSAAAFMAASKNISSRPRTTAIVPWTPAPWPTVSDRGEAQRTPDLSSVLQEIVGRPGWASGNALVLIVMGSGERTAESVDGGVAKAPVLHIEWVP